MGPNQVALPPGFVLDGATVEPPPGFVLDSAMPKPTAEAPPRGVMAEIGRQAGLTARYGMEGLGQVADIVGAPLANVANYVGGTDRFKAPSAAMSGLANTMGLPSPETGTERVVGDASRMLVGTGAVVGGAGALVQGAQGVGRSVAQSLAANPSLQASSAIGAGAAGGAAKEGGADAVGQVAASVAGGLAAPLSVAGVTSAARGIRGLVASPKAPDPAKIQSIVNQAIEQNGIKQQDVPKRVMDSILADAAEAAKTGPLSPDAIRRLADYRLVGAAPSRAGLTLNPIDITRQRNLAKIGANSSDPRLQAFAMAENDNTGKLIGKLNDLGAESADDAYRGGQTGIKALKNTIDSKEAEIGSAYKNAREYGGVEVTIDHQQFVDNATKALKKALLWRALPPDVKAVLRNPTGDNGVLTVGGAEEIKTAIGAIQRNSSDGNVQRGIGLVRQALDDTPAAAGQGEETIAAFNVARKLNYNWRTLVEKTPALKAVEDGVQPDTFVNDFIIRKSTDSSIDAVARLKNSIKKTPEAVESVRLQLLAHLKSAALNKGPDETMKFSQSAYNKALNDIGDRKLKMFMSPRDVKDLHAVGRVALYEKLQPDGSAVNNSNTASAAMKAFDVLANNSLINKIPGGKQFVGDPIKNIGAGIEGRYAMSAPKALMLQNKQFRERHFPAALLLAPGLSTGDE